MQAPLNERIRVLTELTEALVAAQRRLIAYLQEVEAEKREPNANLEFFERMAVRDLRRLVDELRENLDSELGG
jgi:GAF domain-containing protein